MMNREERDKIGRDDWPNLPDDVLRELRDFKSKRIEDLVAHEESTGDYQDFGVCGAINSLQHEVTKLNEMLNLRMYLV